MADMQEREFVLFLDVRVEGYGTEAHEEKVAREVERLLRVSMGDRVSVSLIRDDPGSDGDEGNAFVRCDGTCRRGEPEWQSGRVIYRCVDCGAPMNVPDGARLDGASLGARLARTRRRS